MCVGKVEPRWLVEGAMRRVRSGIGGRLKITVQREAETGCWGRLKLAAGEVELAAGEAETGCWGG